MSSPRRRRALWRVVAWIALAAAAPGACRHADPLMRIDPRPAATISSDLSPGGVRRFAFDLSPGEFLRLDVSQGRADLVVTLRAPDDREAMRLDTVTPVPKEVPEQVRFVAAREGTHLLEVTGAAPETAGHFRISILERRPATQKDRHAARALALLAGAEKLRRTGDAASEGRALPLYEASARESSTIGDSAAEAYTRIQKARVLAGRGVKASAENELRRALSITRAAPLQVLHATAVTELARLLPSLGRGEEAIALLEEALGLWRRSRVVSRVAQVENELALRAQERGELAVAERWFLASIASRTEEGNGYEIAQALANLGTLYESANANQLALDTIQRAEQKLPVGASVGDRSWLLSKRGEALARLGRFDEAERALLGSRELLAESGESAETSAELGQIDRRLGQVSYQLGRYGEAVDRYRSAFAAFEKAHEVPSQIGTTQDLAWAELRRGRLDEAERLLTSVPEQARTIGDRWIELAALNGLARVERARRRPQWAGRALARARDALQLAEQLRHQAGRADLGSAVFADRQVSFDLTAELLVERFHATGDPAFAAEAFEVAERSRARHLLDLVAIDDSADAEGSTAGTGAAEKSAASRAVSRAEEELRRLHADGASSQRIADAEADLRHALIDLRRSSRSDPRRLSAMPLSLGEIRKGLDRQTALLEFDLGEEASVLWVVTRESLTPFSLPDRVQVEQRVKQALEVLSDPGITAESVQAAKLLEETTKLLLGSALPSLRAPRWLIVADGALQALPIGALPDPFHPGQPILASREVVYAPSASVAIQLAERVRRASKRGRELAVFADPIYGADDERVPKSALRGPEPVQKPSKNSGRELDLPRLLGSRAEARRILDLVPPSQRIEALGPEATKERILSGVLSPVRLLHFAVHGLPSLDQPELSSLALSSYGPAGRPIDGTLHAYEISRLHLTADLAVLSACQSGQGAQIAGEGLVGLAHAFLAAGAARVVASYWPIQDEATPELMGLFYEGLLRKHLSPSRALQQAQLSIARQERWRRPYYWAGFSVQGGF